MERMCEEDVDYATHIRGRVYMAHYVGPGLWITMEVRNAATGELIAWDNGYGSLAEAHEKCIAVVTAARMAWMHGFGSASVRHDKAEVKKKTQGRWLDQLDRRFVERQQQRNDKLSERKGRSDG